MAFPPCDLDPGLPDALSRYTALCTCQRLKAQTGCDSTGVTSSATELVSHSAQP